MSENLQNWDDFLVVASLSDIGMRRSNNQDNLSISLASNWSQWHRRGHLFIVADGMGAHAAGELASEMAVDHIPHAYSRYDDLPVHEALRNAVIDANTEIYKRGQANEEFHNMGTTCSTLLLMPQGALVAHVGDSRVYRLRKSRLEQLTFDHSLVWEMRRGGQVSEAELSMGKIPKNVITRSLGPYHETKVDLEGPFPILVDDKFLLCSDGLTGLIDDGELGSLMDNLPPDEAVRVLVDLSNLRGGPDNITCIIVQIKHPQLTTNANSHNESRSSRTKTLNIHPLTWAVLIGSGLATLGFGVFNDRSAALVPGAIFVGSVIWWLVQLFRGFGDHTEQARGLQYGLGPYVQVQCPAGQELANQLQDMAKQIVDVAEKQNWEIDISAFHKLQSAAQKLEGPEAVRAYARCISFLMDQLRNQS